MSLFSNPNVMALLQPTRASAVHVKAERGTRQDIPKYRGFVRVSVGAGDESEDFDIHEAILTARSSFFKAALSGDWFEATTRVVRLPEEDPNVFQNYVHLLYTNVPYVKPKDSVSRHPGHEEQISLAKLYVLAEKLQDVGYKQAALRAMHNCINSVYNAVAPSKKIPGMTCIQAVYEGTPVGSPMRRLLVDYYTYNADKEWLRKRDDPWPNEFIRELAISLLEKRQKPLDWLATFEDPSVYFGTSPTPSE